MPCYYPIKAWKSGVPNKSGKFGFVFKPISGQLHMELPCGSCVGCKLEYSRQWAVRCMHEASLYEDNCFITLTFSDAHLPRNMSLDKSHFQDFIKRLRFKYYGSGKSGVRYFHCGEYGERFGRPHYHACLFNFDFPDKVMHRFTARGDRIWRSSALEELWPFGLSEVGSVTFESAAYVARYVMKKVEVNHALDHYHYVDTSTGELFVRQPEYTTMSRRPGIGKPWLDKYMSDVFPDDFVISRGMKMKPPKYYKSQFELTDINSSYNITMRRMESAKRLSHDNTPERRKVRETVKLAQISQLKRSL